MQLYYYFVWEKLRYGHNLVRLFLGICFHPEKFQTKSTASVKKVCDVGMKMWVRVSCRIHVW